MADVFDQQGAEERFCVVFSHLGALTAYARRCGSLDADAVAAEAMAIAWRRLADVPQDDPRPWLYATARNLLSAEARRRGRRTRLLEPEGSVAPPEGLLLDLSLQAALRSLRSRD